MKKSIADEHMKRKRKRERKEKKRKSRKTRSIDKGMKMKLKVSFDNEFFGQYLNEAYFLTAESLDGVGAETDEGGVGQASFSESARRTRSKRDIFL